MDRTPWADALGKEFEAMMTSLVITFMAPDRPGLVELLSRTVADHGGNWLESKMSRLAGRFGGILLVSVPKANADGLMESLRGLEAHGRLRPGRSREGEPREGESESDARRARDGSEHGRAGREGVG